MRYLSVAEIEKNGMCLSGVLEIIVHMINTKRI